MKRSYLESLYKDLTQPENSSRDNQVRNTSGRPKNLKRFYLLGVNAKREGLSLADVMHTEWVWRELKSSSELETSFFTAGFYGSVMPALPDQVTRQAAAAPPLPVQDKEPPVAKVVEAARPPTADPMELASNTDLAQEVKLLKTLVGLLEQKLAQPVTVHNAIVTPKVKRTVSSVKRDGENNIDGQIVDYEHED